jgi:mRNA interferase MazF
MIKCNWGDVVLVRFPFTNMGGEKKRPGIIISTTTFHSKRTDYLVLALSESRGQQLYPGDFELAKWNEAGLVGPAIAKGRIATVDKTMFYKKLGKLHSDDIATLVKSLDKWVFEKSK